MSPDVSIGPASSLDFTPPRKRRKPQQLFVDGTPLVGARLISGVKWVPPVSPYGLIQEQLYQDPWKVLVACMLLNKTGGRQVNCYAAILGFSSARVADSTVWVLLFFPIQTYGFIVNFIFKKCKFVFESGGATELIKFVLLIRLFYSGVSFAHVCQEFMKFISCLWVFLECIDAQGDLGPL